MNDTIHGIERDLNSDSFGEVVVPIVHLWKQPAPVIEDMGEDALTGALRHGEAIEVIRSKTVNGFEWCFVETDVIHEDVTYTQKGWLRASLLLNAGAVE